jgi:hypothetical protein
VPSLHKDRHLCVFLIAEVISQSLEILSVASLSAIDGINHEEEVDYTTVEAPKTRDTHISW